MEKVTLSVDKGTCNWVRADIDLKKKVTTVNKPSGKASGTFSLETGSHDLYWKADGRSSKSGKVTLSVGPGLTVKPSSKTVRPGDDPSTLKFEVLYK